MVEKLSRRFPTLYYLIIVYLSTYRGENSEHDLTCLTKVWMSHSTSDEHQNFAGRFILLNTLPSRLIHFNFFIFIKLIPSRLNDFQYILPTSQWIHKLLNYRIKLTTSRIGKLTVQLSTIMHQTVLNGPITYFLDKNQW